MEWTTCIKGAINYMENHLLDIQTPKEVADHVYISPMYLQRGFQIMTGYSISEYIRNRRLYHSALELAENKEKIIDIAYKYGYETPESFTKAFTRFHGATPSEVRKNRHLMKPFHPLRISIVIQGGERMDFTVDKMAGFKIIGFSKEFSFENPQEEIPKFWDEIYEKYCQGLFTGNTPANEIEQAVYDNRIGEFGVCIDDIGKDGNFLYMIAGRYMGGEIPPGLEIYDLPDSEWAKFKCVGAMPDAIQTVNAQIWKEWLPGNAEYELAGKYNIEWYSNSGNMTDADYQSEVWIPVNKK
ncbi:MAG: AraC family transcriptional regulator [Lachnospiraceae bacterium]|nr:AraC family transcriptional regulator [Lachnospiraceae bacterium]